MGLTKLVKFSVLILLVMMSTSVVYSGGDADGSSDGSLVGADSGTGGGEYPCSGAPPGGACSCGSTCFSCYNIFF